MHSRILAAALAASLAVSAACSDSTSPAASGHVGAYPLRTVDGHQPPQIVASGPDGNESIVGGLVLLRTDNSFMDSTEVQIVTSTGVAFRHDVARGTYRLSGDSVFFAFQGAEYAMRHDGAELIQDFNGIELVYRR